jgi:twinkle protein
MANHSTRSFADFNIDIPPGRGGEVDLLCPQCSSGRRREHQRDRCLSVNVDKGTWKCHNCGWSGSLNEPDWRDGIAPRAKVSAIHRAPIRDELPAIELPDDPQLNAQGVAFFQRRAIPATVARRFGVWSARRRFAGEERPCVCFPYTINGQHVNVKYRALDKHFGLEAGRRVVFFNTDAVRGMAEGEVLIVEGEMDVLALATAGIDNAISVPNGANSLTDEAMESIAFLFDNQKITFVLAVDADGPGQRLEIELAQRLGMERCKRVAWPECVKDANDLLMDEGKEALREAVDAAEYFPVEGIVGVDDVSDAVWRLYFNGYPGGYDVGFDALKGLWSVRAGELNLVTGAPGSGKSHLVDQTLVNLSALHDLRHAIFSPEMGPTERHVADLAAKYTGLPFLEGQHPRMTESQLADAMEWVKQRFWWVEMEEPTIDAVLERFRILRFRHGVHTVTIDPWNELEVDFGKLTETQFIGRSLRRINRFLRLNGVIGNIVAHPRLLPHDVATGNFPIVTMWDVAGSANWANKANAVISVHRDRSDPSSNTQIHVQKIRFRELGKLGMGEVKYDVVSGSFHDPGTAIGGQAWQRARR